MEYLVILTPATDVPLQHPHCPDGVMQIVSHRFPSEQAALAWQVEKMKENDGNMIVGKIYQIKD